MLFTFIIIFFTVTCLSLPWGVYSSSLPPPPSPSQIPPTIRTQNNPTTDNEGDIIPERPKRRFSFQGPILTVTLKDPFADDGIDQNQPTSSFSSEPKGDNNKYSSEPSSVDDTAASSSTAAKKRHYFWSRNYNPSSYANFLNLNALAPTLIYSIRSTAKPLPNYLPWLQSTSITTGYKYDNVKDKPSFVEGEMKFRKNFGSHGKNGGSARNVAIEVDVEPSYMVKEQKAALVVKVGVDGGNGIDEESSGFGCFGLARFVMNKGKKVQHLFLSKSTVATLSFSLLIPQP